MLPRAAAGTDGTGVVLFQNVCAVCHGTKGEGREDMKTPSIASLPSWYVATQLGNFHDGRRGNNPALDPQGATMAAIAKAVKPDQALAVAKHVEALPLVAPAQREIPGANLSDGQRMFYERCMDCHRYNASGEMAFGSPPLVGRQGWYLIAQLKKFKQLHRGAAKGDVSGAKMTQMVTFLENEQAMKDVVAFILTLNPKPAPAVEDELFKPRK
ncbi:MAG: c-type cytochrome [Prosthecobacter sp.]|nr:c-type cytochrome [Prosthecobacter sp.]